MPGIDLINKPLLNPAQDRLVTETREIADALVWPEDGSDMVPGEAAGFLVKLTRSEVGSRRQVARMGKRTKAGRVATTPEELEWELAEEVTSFLCGDAKLEAIIRLAETAAAIQLVKDKEDAAEEIGRGTDQLIEFRTLRSATMGLSGARMLLQTGFGVDTAGRSAYAFAGEIYKDHPRMKKPADITKTQAEELEGLLDRRTSPYHGETSYEAAAGVRGVVRHFRHLRHVQKTQESRWTMSTYINLVAESLHGTQIVSLTEEERRRVANYMAKMSRYVERAATVDSTYAQEPIVRAFVFLCDQIGVMDPRAARQSFERNVKKNVKIWQ